jgi:predicted ATP-grasp superfamily ATP-dependent carboligase
VGDPGQFAQAQSRAAFIDMARRDGVRAPLTLPVERATDLRQALREVGLPAMLKLDRSWGGEGVAKVNTMAQAERAFAAMSRRRNVADGLRRLVTIGDPFQVLPGISREQPRLNVQAYVTGRPANCIASCWEGRVLALIQVDVLTAIHAMGPATVVQISDHPAIAEAARRVVARLGLSGFCGLDFIVEDGTGDVHLIEMNQRITPIGHLALGAGRDPVASLSAQFAGGQGNGAPARPRTTGCGIVALFPQAWRSDPQSPHFAVAYHDVPWTEPDLVRKLLQTRWTERSRLVRLIRRLRRMKRLDDASGRANFVRSRIEVRSERKEELLF